MGDVLTVAERPERPVLIYDGECRFCCFWVERWRAWTKGAVEFVTSQEVIEMPRWEEIPREEFDRAVQLVLPDGRVLSGAAAAFGALERRWAWLGMMFRGMPGMAGASEWAYGLVARNRVGISRIWRTLSGPHIEVPEYRLTAWLMLRGLGLVFLVAFWSLWSQIIPLSGAEGIVPIAERMQAIAANTQELSALERLWRMPTVFWFAAGDGFLNWMCALGCLLSAGVLIGLATMPCLIGAWFLYLSFVQVGAPWLNFQWDILLLEAGLLGALVSRLGLFDDPRKLKEPRFLPWLLTRWLVFRLMFASGMVKLLSGDTMWADWTALTVHYETQPLPNPMAWHVHHLPEWFHKASCGIMFGIELILPFCFFLPRRLRLFAAVSTVALMAVIICTGNYTFFNWLVIVLCLSLGDDRFLKAMLPLKLRDRLAGRKAEWSGRFGAAIEWGRWGGTTIFAAVTVWFSIIYLMPMMKLEAPELMRRWAGKVGQFHPLGSYGLFAVMTKDRPEIVIEGSRDGVEWMEYEFAYKPGGLKRGLPIVAPHQPRLDWQMWFAALGNLRGNQWLALMSLRLLEGNERVGQLFAMNPFADEPPRYLRAKLYRYNFTTRAEREKSGRIWKREFVGMYLPPVGLESFRRN